MLRILVFPLITLAFLIGCRKPTEPSPPTGADTTSHDFVWTIDTLGDGNSSILNDVCIIDANNIWAVGEVYLKDTSGQIDPTRYNLAVWNGDSWSIRRVPYNYGGLVFYHPIQSAFALAANDIWLCGNGVIRWDGAQFHEMPIPTSVWGQYRMNKIWGSSDNDLYVVGNGGSIAHFNGSSWTKTESGTTVDFQDIWGAYDATSGQFEILAVASLKLSGYGLDLFQINGATVQKIDTAGLRLSESSLWFQPGRVFYVVGDGVFVKQSISDHSWKQQTDQPLIYKERVRGNAWNDVFVSGDFGLMSHYNGSTWQHYTGATLPLASGILQGLSVKGNLVVAVGPIVGGRSIVVRGVRVR